MMRRSSSMVGFAALFALAGCTGLLGIEEATLAGPQDPAATADAGDAARLETGPTHETSDAAAAAPEVSADAACGDARGDDAKNCGVCGHDCLGGACVTGVCQPSIFASGQESPRSISIHDGMLAWHNQGTPSAGTVMACDRECTSGPWPVAKASYLTALAHYNGGIAFASMATLSWCPFGGCTGASPPAVLGTSLTAIPFAVAGDRVHLMTRDRVDGGGNLAVVRSHTKSGTDAVLASEPATFPNAAVAADAGAVYWQRGTSIMTCPAEGCPASGAVVLVSGVNAVQLVSNGAVLAWSVLAGPITVCDLPSCTIRRDLIREVVSNPITLDATHVYWADSNTSTVRRRSLASAGDPEILARAQNTPTSVAVDETSIYFTNTNQGAVMRLAK